MSKIEDYKLVDVVVRLHRQGKSQVAIASELNKMIPKDEEPISNMAVARWLKANNEMLNYLEKAIDSPLEQRKLNSTPMFISNQNGVEASIDVNPYEETLKLIDDCDIQIETLRRRIDNVKRASDNQTIDQDSMKLLSQFIARKQTLLADIAQYQKEMASFANVQIMVKMVYEALKETSPEALEKFKEKIIKKQNIVNMFRG